MSKPVMTPWGEAQTDHELIPGIRVVTTAGHGGVLVDQARAEELLSPAGRAIGSAWHGYLAFEEDCDWAVIAYEYPDQWAARQRGPVGTRLTPAEVKAHAERVIHRWNPDYFRDETDA